MNNFIKYAKKISDKALNLLPNKYQGQVTVSQTENETFRFAKNQITQNTSDKNISLHISLNLDGKEGVFETNDLSEKGIENAVNNAIENSKFSLVDKDFAGYAQKQDLDLEIRDFSIAKPKIIIDKIGTIFEISKKERVDVYGSLSNEKSMIYLQNTNDHCAYDSMDLNTIVLISYDGLGSGYIGRGFVNIEDLDVESLVYESIQKARVPLIDRKIDLGYHKVILEAPATATLMNVLAFSSFSSEALNEKRSFMSGNLNKQIFPECVNISDDPYHPYHRSLRIDFEGNRKSKVNLIKNGVASEVVNNLRTSKKYGGKNTGHALLPPQKEPLPLDVMMHYGDTSMEDLIKSVDKGLYVTRFHYIGLIDEKNTTITGMTRDGTFLIENGKIVGALTDLRFTDNITDILKNTVSVEDKCYNIPGFLWGANIAPAILTNKFKITGFKPKG